MQIKNRGDEDDSDNEGSVPIYSSLESLLIIPPSMSKKLHEKAAKAQEVLDKWSTNRRIMAKKMYMIADELEGWEKGSAVSTTVGSSVGVASGFAVIGGLVLMPTVAVAGLVMGTVAGASNLVTGLLKGNHWKKTGKCIEELCSEDTRKFEELLKAREDLMDFIREVIREEEVRKTFHDNPDSLNNIKELLGGSAFAASGLGARYAIGQMGRMTSSLVKGVLHAMAAISIIFDSITLYFSAKNLVDGSPCQFAEEVRGLSDKLELHRQKVCREFLNQDIWNSDDLEQLEATGSDIETEHASNSGQNVMHSI